MMTGTAILRRGFRRLLIGAPPKSAKELGYLTMGEGSYGDPRVVRFEGDSGLVRIGRYCSIAADVEFIPGGNHRVDWVTTFPIRAAYGLPGAYMDGHPSSKGNITVGNDVWIGRGARVLSGVTIGDGAVIGGFSVVSRDVEPFAIVAGNPAEFRRYRFPVDICDDLMRIRWWDWPPDVVRARADLLCDSDVARFVEVFRGERGRAGGL